MPSIRSINGNVFASSIKPSIHFTPVKSCCQDFSQKIVMNT
nr:MAG TPA: hypothetical protein [Caudoviricetes sp.]